ncbi:SAM-dependent methyltransferase [Silvibacterium bohemicum]|uniref:SAM-dependent methyltransferase n=1 Tax=Silvibacterium bohemicum TaxID=1577686 RepID=A0A841JTE1_9BACT|nr:class I SAM-dependent methyltransferase [Silvibacterium bohemicum]MBB6144596.1 SAM-dependent methyltransferase [Silvibacterium bohemicum]
MKPTERFTSRVDSYRRHRPHYPQEIVTLLERECGLHRSSAIADIAAGTGLLAEIFLEQDYPVTAIEPNDAMREVCRELIAEYPQLQCLSGTAEATGLGDNSIDLITVAQAMHWFDLKRTRTEFRRILRPSGWCAVIYNNRRMSGDSFHEGYEQILADFGRDYAAVRDSHLTPEGIAAFFAPDGMKEVTFPNAQDLDLQGLEGRVLSSSYMPQPGHPRCDAMRLAIADLFKSEERNGHVRMEYECSVAYGQLTTSAFDDIES